MVDYTKEPLWFRIRKVLRYVRLYGPGRTMVKVRGQYHMNRTFDSPPRLKGNPDGHVGMLGCGNFAYSVIAWYLKKHYGNVIRGAMDVDPDRAMSLAQAYNLEYFTDDPVRVIEDPDIDLIYIASNHSTHAEYAIDALKNGKSVHIEKPHVVTEDQLIRLCCQMSQSTGSVGLGFNRPNSKIGRLIKKHLADQPGPMMLNWFVAGHEINPDHWYFHDKEGGRVLGNLCHWTDFVYQMMPEDARYPIEINPTRAEKSDCDIAVSYTFGDGSIAVITFSAKGHTFEGVREILAAHRGNTLISMADFKTLTVEVVDRKLKFAPWYRDHGHGGAILFSWEASRKQHPGCPIKYVWETGELFLKTREALEQNCKITLQKFEDSPISTKIESLSTVPA